MKLEGFFSDIKHGNNAVEELKKAGFENASIDLVEDEINNAKTNLPGTEFSTSLSDLVLGSGSTVVTDESKASLTAANPMVSGMGTVDEITDINCKVIVEVNGDNIDKAKKIISKANGTLNNPIVHEPKIVGNEDRVLDIALNRLNKNV